MGKKILIVEDEAEIAELTKVRLESNNYEVITAKNGLEGLEKADKENPNLILLDIKMPEMDGYTVLRKLKENKKTEPIPVIMLTAFGDMKELFAVEGIADFIVKPYESKDLLGKIAKALG